MRIGVDLMGSDRSPQELFKAVIQAAEAYPHLVFVVLATESAIQELKPLTSAKNIHFYLVKEVIGMEEEPVRAIRTKRNSSLVVGIRLIKKSKLKAFVTTGNTGALIAAASVSLEKLPGIKRPALLATLPSVKGCVSVIDAGGSVLCKAPLLYQYALMGADYHRQIYGINAPRIGLLNVGNESKKGTLEHQEAFRLLSSHSGFVGNVEGREIFEGKVDLLVTDGFTGNVLLKTAEGVAGYIFKTLENHLSPVCQNELIPLLPRFKWDCYPGAIVMGVKGLVIKCHGSSGAKALLSGIQGAISLL